MRSRGLSFADAVKLPDGDSALVSQLGQIAGIPAGAVTIASGGGLDFSRCVTFDALDEWMGSAPR
jgi:hypothetical protein